MKIKCLHGYFIFEEMMPGEISKFMNLTKLELAPVKNYYAFSTLDQAPRYSLLGGEYLGAVSTKTYEGEPWEVMRENGLVYDFVKDLVVPIETVINLTEIKQASNYFISNGLIMAGSITDDGSRITDYAAFFSFSKSKYVYSEVTYG